MSEESKAAADAFILQLATYAVKGTEQSDDPRLRAIEQFILGQLGDNIRELVMMAANAAEASHEQQTPGQTAQAQLARQQEQWNEQLELLRQRNAQATKILENAILDIVRSRQNGTGTSSPTDQSAVSG